MAQRIAFAAGALTMLLATPAIAHHPGGTGNTGAAGPINTIPATTLEQGHFALALAYEYIRLGGLSNEDLIAAAARHQHVHSLKTIESPSLSAAFGITDDLMVSFRLPYVRRTNIREGHHEHDELTGAAINSVDFRGDSEGIGDLTMFGQWRFLKNSAAGTQVAALFGVKVPTGTTNRVDRFGELFETEFQPGSGSTDGLVGIAVTQPLRRWSLDGNVLYQFTGNGTQDTNLGDRFQYNAAVSYRLIGGSDPLEHAHAHVVPHRHGKPVTKAPTHRHEQAERSPFALDVVLELNGEWHDKQVIAGVPDPNSGGNVVYLSPGVRISSGNLSGFASIGIPVVNDVNGLQSKPDFRLATGLAAAF
jgi:hypothetical protein